MSASSVIPLSPRFSVITALPDMFAGFLKTGVVGRAVETGLVSVDIVNLHDFGRGRYRQVDDYSFGSGGMVLMPEPLDEALASCDGDAFVVYPSPQGAPLTQDLVESLFSRASRASQASRIVIVCGRYEGADERFIERRGDLEVTVGDCVLTGGEIPAMAIVDAVARLVPGVVGKTSAVEDDSFYHGMLDHPHYTRPADWDGIGVPPVLLSGNAAEINDWRRRAAVARTIARRPDLLARCGIGGYMKCGLYAIVTPERDTPERVVREWMRICSEYGVERLIAIAGEDGEDRERWTKAGTKVFSLLTHALLWIARREKTEPLVFDGRLPRHWPDMKRTVLEQERPVAFCFAEDEGVPLPLGARLAVVLDRFLGTR
ncbi:MAG: tRNA (guanosine(37)-N1)-methyltransferase TrmD [Synergistaceae bacterium]|nr:tRNA (guanosine(37)-N1)-methyltransferase TrmD [Synergistaceae bacterium]